MSNQLVKGLSAGTGDGEWASDFQLTDTDSWHSLFKVKQDGSGVQLNLEYPKGVTATLSGGGTLPSGKYYYAVTALNQNGETIRGFNQEVSATSDGSANQTITVAWLNVPGASSYNVYRTTTSGVYGASSLLVNELAGTLSYANSDTTALSSGTPPSATTAYLTFNSQFPANQMGRSYSLVTAGGVATATGTSAQTLATFTLPKGVLASTGQGVKIRAWGSTAANTNNKTAILKFGATTVCTSGTMATSGEKWVLEAEVYRNAATTQVSLGKGFSAENITALTVQQNGTPAETLANAIACSCVVTDGSSSAGDATLLGFVVELVG